MQNGPRAWFFAILLSLTAAAGQSPDEGQLARFKDKIRRDMSSIGNYTCLETIKRTRRAPPSNEFRPVDTVRLEVSTVAGKELFAKPGQRFEDRDVAAVVTSGIIGSGTFSQFVRSLFLQGKGTLRYGRRENLAGHGALRNDFRMTQQESGFKLQFFNTSEMVAAKGSFWFDPVSLDLMRVEIHGRDIPYDLHLAEAAVRIDYARTHIGNADALLPKRSELTLTYLSGDTNRDVTEFTQCREYRTESTISFRDGSNAPAQRVEQPPTPQETPEPGPAEAAIPAALEVSPPQPAALPGTTAAPSPASLVPPPPSPAAIAPVAQPPGDRPETVLRDEPVSFKSQVNLVMVPVVVRDRKGRAVGGLRKESFQLFDGSRRQEIAHFSVQETAGSAVQRPAGPVAVTEKNQPEAQEAVQAERFVAYVFDDVDVRFEDLVYVRDAAWRNISESLQPADRVAIVATSGRTLLDFTDDRAKLHDALFHLRPNSLYRPTARECPDLNYYQAYAITKGMGGGVSPTTPSPGGNGGGSGSPDPGGSQPVAVAIQELENCSPMFDPRNKAPDPVAENLEVELAARRVVSWREHEIEVVLNSLKILTDRMASLPGQRSIILVSPGFFVTDTLWPHEMELTDRAIRAGVTVSALDALGLSSLNPAGEIDESTPAGAAHPRVSEEKVQFRKAENQGGAQALAALAEGTGGKFIENSNDFIGAYRQLANPPEFVYVLGFAPQDVKPNGSFHRLKVKLSGGGKYDLQARRGYFAPQPGDEIVADSERQTRDAVSSRMEIRTLPVELHTALDRSDPTGVKLTVTVGIDVKQLRLKRLDGRNSGELTVVVALFDANGGFISGNKKIVNLRLRDETVRTPAEEPPLLLKAAFSAQPGAYRVRLVVRDEMEQTLHAQNEAVAIP